MSHCQSKYLPPRRVGCWSRLEQGWGPDSCVVHLCVIEWNSGNKKSHYPPAKPTALNKKALDGGSPSGVGLFLRPPHLVPPQQRVQLPPKPRDCTREQGPTGCALPRLITHPTRWKPVAMGTSASSQSGGLWGEGGGSGREGIKRSGEWALLPNTLLSTSRLAVICCP